MYFLRAGSLAQQPAIVGYNLEQGHNGGRPKAVQAAEVTGMPAFQLDQSKYGAISKAIPDTFGLSDTEIATMPTFCRSSNAGIRWKRATRAAVNRNGILRCAQSALL
jgi:hypothetical protein